MSALRPRFRDEPYRSLYAAADATCGAVFGRHSGRWTDAENAFRRAGPGSGKFACYDRDVYATCCER